LLPAVEKLGPAVAIVIGSLPLGSLLSLAEDGIGEKRSLRVIDATDM